MKVNIKNIWDKSKNWQRFGLIFALLSILIVIKSFNCSGEGDLVCWRLLAISSPAVYLTDLLIPFSFRDFAIWIFIPLQFFLIGALIGLLIDKIRSKKPKKK